MEKNKRISKAVKNFAPSWFSSVMGTALIPVALWNGRENAPIYEPMAYFFFFTAIFLFLIFIFPWTIRFFNYFENVKKDFNNPVMSSFFSTMPISLLILSLDFVILGKNIFGHYAENIAKILFFTGTAGVILIGFIVLSGSFIKNNTDIDHANFGWFVSSVSPHLLIPVAGFELMKYYQKTQVAEYIFVLSMIGLGIGLFLYIFVGATVYHRYVFHKLPVPTMASTFFIGIVPPAILAIILTKIDMNIIYTGISFDLEAIHTFSVIMAVVCWGFALWWFITSIIVISYHISKRELSYTLSWWAFTFPIGNLSSATGGLYKMLKIDLFIKLLHIINFILILVWLIVFVETLKYIVSKIKPKTTIIIKGEVANEKQ